MLKDETVQISTQGVSPEKVSKMEEKSRKTGIDAVGDAPFGTHFCLFYETKEDLIDVLVPYFKAGLESNEFCMWVTSEPLSEEEAKEAMRRAVPNFDGYVERGQIEIVPYAEWYLKGGAFNLQRVLNGWVEKLNQALAKGYDGMRLTGNTAWLEKRDWKNFVDYEREVNDVIGKYRMITLCTYSLEKCGASEVIDVVRNHQFAVVKKEGKWELIESSEIKRAEEALRRSEEKYRSLVELAPDGIATTDMKGVITSVNTAFSRWTGFSEDELVGKHFTKLGTLRPVGIPKYIKLYGSVLRGKIPPLLEFIYLRKDGTTGWVEAHTGLTKVGNKTVGFHVIARDITERKKAEESLRESEQRFRCLVEDAASGVGIIDLKGRFTYVNKTLADSLGYSVQELAGRPFKDFLHPDDRGKVVRLFLKSILLRRPPQNLEFRVIHKDGHVLHCISKPTRLLIDGKTVGFEAIIIDITERKKAEESLEKEQDELDCIIDSSPIIIFYKDKEGQFIRVNKTLAEALKMPKEEFLGKTVFDLYSAKIAQGMTNDDSEVLKSGRPKLNIIEQYESASGIRWVQTDKVPIFDKNGIPAGLVGFAQDITERKKAEESLRESEEKNRKTIENANVGIITYGPEGEVKILNPKMEEMIGFNRTEILTLVNWFEKLYPNEEERRKVRDKWFKRMSGEGEVKEGHAIITTKEGKRRNFLFNAVQLESGDSIAFAHDITERKKAEEALRQTKEYLDNLLNYANAPVIVWDNENKISLFNNAFEALTGYKKESVLGRNIAVLFPPLQKEEILQTIEKATKGEKWQSVEVPILCKGKETRIALWNSANITDKDGNIVATIAQGQDITERKNMEKWLKEYSEHLEEKVEERTIQLKKTQEQLLKAERLAAIGEAAGMVGHDLRNPLQAITNMVYLSEKKSKSIPITEKEILEKHGFLELRSGLKEQVEYMEKIVSNLQDYARPVKPTPVEIGLHQLINKTLSSLTVPENAKVSIVIEKDFPKLTLDPTLMQRVFSNLITNAMQAMPNGGKLTIRASKKEETALISIEDTGAGISDENLSKLFMPLFTTKAKGQGFGLPVCKRLVEAHDGNITVESKVGKGSTFTVEIPLRKEVSYQ
jgi:PAS domain S-box-containing protein